MNCSSYHRKYAERIAMLGKVCLYILEVQYLEQLVQDLCFLFGQPTQVRIKMDKLYGDPSLLIQNTPVCTQCYSERSALQ